jgi:signal transduction histidine kinase
MRWPANVETAMFRVAQEAITNIRKHAGGPCPVELMLTAGGGLGPYRLVVRDQGRGCPAEKQRKARDQRGLAVGIDVMRERMVAVGGELRWEARPGQGVTVTALLPAGEA